MDYLVCIIWYQMIWHFNFFHPILTFYFILYIRIFYATKSSKTKFLFSVTFY